VILPNAKIVVGGYSTGGYAAATNELVRYNGDGSLDPSFGNGGIAFIDFSVEDLAIQPNGDLVAAGYRDGPDRPEFAVARYTPTGHPDPAFGSAGTVVTDFGATDIATSVVLEPNGRIIAAGYSDTNTDMQDIAQDYDFALAGYTEDGHLDTTFGHGGLVLTDNASINDYGYDAALAPDGRLVVAGTDGVNFAVTRYDTNGTVDQSFGNSGRALTSVGSSTAQIYGVAVQPNGKIVAGGSAAAAGGYDFALARYLPR
jgi:uncharacterized delta-60 repeat protein